MSLPCLRDTDAGVEISLFIQPRSSRNKVVGLQGRELKLALTAPPVNGAANKACCAFIAKFCGLPKNKVALISGQSSRHKRLLLMETSLSQVAALLENLPGT